MYTVCNGRISGCYLTELGSSYLLWADVTVTKRRQQLDEIKSFLLAHTGNQQSCLQENSARRVLYEIRERICNKRMLTAQECGKFHRYRMTEILVNNLADFPDVVQVKKSRSRSVDGNVLISNISYYHFQSRTWISLFCLSSLRSLGSYFHKNASYSDSYAKHDSNGQKRMFVARVLIGSFTRGSSHLRRPPPKNPAKPLEDFYDSCVDDVGNPRIYVVFENNQVYPEYIITYKW